MKMTDIRERNDDELRSLASELKRNLWKARFDNHAGQLDDTSQIPRLRRDLARVFTEQTARVRTQKAASQVQEKQES